MRTRKATVIAASVGVAVAAATGVTYASSALESAPRSASIVQDAAPVAPRGGNGTGTEAGSNAASDPGHSDSWRPSKGNEGRGGNGGESRGENRGENRGDNRGDHRRHDEGQIQVNERVYGAEPGSCIAVVNVRVTQAGADTFNIRNDSDKTVEFFNGITCDNGAPIATVGPHSSSSAVAGDRAGNLIIGSFRVFGPGHHS